MALDSISTLKKNRVYAPMIMGLSIMLMVFVAKPAYTSYDETTLAIVSAENNEASQQKKLSTLQAQQKKLEDETSEIAKSVQKISKDFDSAGIIESIMIGRFTTPALSGLASKPPITVTDLTIDRGSQEPNGIYRGTVTMTVAAQNPEMIAAYLDYITSNTPYYFALNTVSLPVDTETQTSEEVSVPVTLGFYYYP